VQPEWTAFRQALKVGTLKIEVDPNGPNGTKRMTLGEYWALDGSPIEEGIVIERGPTTMHGDRTGAGSQPKADVVVPETAGPAGVGLVAVPAAGNAEVRTLTREEGRARAAAR